MELRVAGIVRESVVDGPGIRSVVFAQGCPRYCKGCHNPETIDPNGGKVMEAREIIDQISKVKLIKGVTFSGGEPFLQAGAFAQLGRRFKERGLDIMTYTGYTWHELLELGRRDKAIRELLEVSDYLVDGPFIEAQKDLNLPFRGSKNQRIIDVRQSLQSRDVVLARFAG